jgi:hypothetical protein
MGKRSKNRWKYRAYRSITTKQERIANCEYIDDEGRHKWGRPKRNSYRLDPWNHEPRHERQKSWKRKRIYQQRSRSELQEHGIYIDDKNFFSWYIEEWFDDHDIPYKIEEIREPRYRIVYGYWTSKIIQPHPNRIELKRTYIKYEIPKRYKYSKTIGWNLIWWSNKDIGIEYILNKYK